MRPTTTPRPKPANLFDVYQCEQPLKHHPGKTRTGYSAVQLDTSWEPIGPLPKHKVNWVRRVIARSKGEAIPLARQKQKGD